MRILTRSSHSDFEKAQPQAPRPESSPANWLEQRRSWGIAVTLRLRIGAKWLQLQCVMVLRGRKGGSLRPQGLSPCVAVTSALGRVSRAPRELSAARNCTRDEGGPFEFGDQEPISSHRKLLRAKAVVVSVAETPGQDFGRHGRERRAQANRCRSVESGLGDVRTGG